MRRTIRVALAALGARLLRSTGSSTSWWVVPLGLLLVSTGALLLVRRDSSLSLTGSHLSGDHT